MSKLKEVLEMIKDDVESDIQTEWYSLEEIINDKKEELKDEMLDKAMDIMHMELGSEFNEEDLDALFEEDYNDFLQFVDDTIYTEWDV